LWKDSGLAVRGRRDQRPSIFFFNFFVKTGGADIPVCPYFCADRNVRATFCTSMKRSFYLCVKKILSSAGKSLLVRRRFANIAGI